MQIRPKLCLRWPGGNNHILKRLNRVTSIAYQYDTVFLMSLKGKKKTSFKVRELKAFFLWSHRCSIGGWKWTLRGQSRSVLQWSLGNSVWWLLGLKASKRSLPSAWIWKSQDRRKVSGLWPRKRENMVGWNTVHRKWDFINAVRSRWVGCTRL